ncbi:quinate permease [Meredithblackwellia eburnea MCA 4105]
MGLKKVEDRPTPKEVYNARIYVMACVAATAAIMIGYDSAFIGTTIALSSFKKEFNLATKTATQFANISANIVSTYQGGCFFGALLGYPTGQLLGRKMGLLLSALVFCLGSGIMLAADSARGLGPIYGGRILAGLGIGAASNLTPLYISEIAPPAIRGQLVGMYEIGWQIGGIVGFWINYGINLHIAPSHKQWIIPFAVQLVPGGLFAIGIPIFIRESPRWLITRGRREEAIANLSYMRKLDANHPYLIEEVNMIDIQIQHDITAVGNGFWAPFKQVFTQWRLAKRLLIVTSLFIFQNGTGINAINYYSPTIFKSIGITGTSTSLFTTGIFGVIKTVGALIWAFLIIDRFGRRGVLLVGSIGGAVGMAAIGAYIKIEQPAKHPSATLPPSGAAALFFFYLWTIFYAVSWNGTPWVVCSETFPGAVRTVTQMCAAASNWLWNFVISRATPTMFLKMQNGGVYFFFMTMMVLSVPFIVFLLPETKNIPLEEMDRLFAPGINRWNANKIVMAELQRERENAGAPTYIHQDKENGTQQRFEDTEKASV